MRLGQGVDEIYHQNNKNFQPRLGFAWDPFKDGKTSVRGAYAILVDQPMTSVVTGTSGNPPLAIPLTFAGTIRFENAIDLAQAAGLAPATVDHGFDNAYLQSWNLNVQRELLPGLAVMAGYFGSKGTHLILRRNINQPVDGVRPYPVVSQSSAILPGTPLGNITQVESTGQFELQRSVGLGEQAARAAACRSTRPTPGRSRSTTIRSARRASLCRTAITCAATAASRTSTPATASSPARYMTCPSAATGSYEGWQLAIVVQAQSGNPVNIVTTNSTVTGVANTLRPDVTGPIAIIGSVDRWFDTSVFTPVARFGNLGRNVVIGPGFNNTDFSIMKNTELGEKIRMQFRVEVFDLFNHANFGQPGNVVGTPGFGRITNTRFPTGESGSSRQMQLGIKLIF